MAKLRHTRFSDVCGTIDDLKRILSEETWEESVRQTLTGYVGDCLFMLERMAVRLHEFKTLRDSLVTLVERMQQIVEPAWLEATRAAEAMTHRFSERPTPTVEELLQLNAQAELIRAAANHAEERLRRFKEISLELGQLYREIEGGRGWQQEGQDAQDAGMDAHLAAWMPPSPHREKILEWLRGGRAHVISRDPDPPLLAFEDGGVMPLKDARWSDAVANFVPTSFEPNPRGRRYRPKA